MLPPNPTPSPEIPWSSERGTFALAAACDTMSDTREIEAQSLEDACAKARAIYTFWPEGSRIRVARQSGGEYSFFTLP